MYIVKSPVKCWFYNKMVAFVVFKKEVLSFLSHAKIHMVESTKKCPFNKKMHLCFLKIKSVCVPIFLILVTGHELFY